MKPTILTRPATAIKTKKVVKDKISMNQKSSIKSESTLTNLLLKKSGVSYKQYSKFSNEKNWTGNMKVKFEMNSKEKENSLLKGNIWILQKRNQKLSELYQKYSDVIYSMSTNCDVNEQYVESLWKDPVSSFLNLRTSL